MLPAANMENLTDEQLIEKIKNNQELFGILIDRYKNKLERYVFYLINRKDELDDIVQEIFIKVFINLNSFDTKKKFSAWFFRIAHNQVVNFFKKYKKTLSIRDDLKIIDDKNIEEDFEKKELKEILKKCIDEISLDYKEIILLYYFQDLSYEEISDVLKIPAGTVATKLSRAKKILKKLCQNKI
ncbi:MAG: RNA polymerase sigma factor [Candidatus Microgenomates bacterium]